MKGLYSRIGCALQVLLFSAMLLGCPPTKPSESGRVEAPPRGTESKEAVAVVNGEELTMTEFERRIEGLNPYARARYSSTEAKLEFLDAQVEFEILADVAERKGYGGRPEVMHAIKEAMVRHYLAEELRKRVSMRDITDDEIRQAYEKDPTAFHKPRARNVALIGADQAKTVEGLREIIEAGTYEEPEQKLNMLRRLADAHHFDPALKRKGGEHGWVEDPASPLAKNEGLNATLAKHVFGLSEVGEVTPVFGHAGKFYIATYIEEQAANVRGLEDVKDEIREKLYTKRREEERQRIIAEAQEEVEVTVNREILEKVEPPDSAEKTLERLLQQGNKVPVRDLKE